MSILGYYNLMCVSFHIMNLYILDHDVFAGKSIHGSIYVAMMVSIVICDYL